MKPSVWPDTPISAVLRSAVELHFVRPLGVKKIRALLKKCPNVSIVSISASNEKRLKPACRKLLTQRGIGLEITNLPGRPIRTTPAKILQAIELRRDFQSLREIERLTGVPRSSVHYLLTKAKRSKLVQRGIVVHAKAN